MQNGHWNAGFIREDGKDNRINCSLHNLSYKQLFLCRFEISLEVASFFIYSARRTKDRIKDQTHTEQDNDKKNSIGWGLKPKL